LLLQLQTKQFNLFFEDFLITMGLRLLRAERLGSICVGRIELKAKSVD
jgi:hypothetical protein